MGVIVVRSSEGRRNRLGNALLDVGGRRTRGRFDLVVQRHRARPVGPALHDRAVGA